MRWAVIVAAATLGVALLPTASAGASSGPQALIVPGTGTADPATVSGFMPNAVGNYIAPNVPWCSLSTCAQVPVDYDASLWPVVKAESDAKWNVSIADGVDNLERTLAAVGNNPNSQVVVFGYSQGATVSSHVKAMLDRLSPAAKQRLRFVFAANPNRPNGGIIERPAMLGTVPVVDMTFGPPAPTNTGIKTTDVAIQYDGISDFPAYPLNLLADANATMGVFLIHVSYLAPNSKHPGQIYGYSAEQLQQSENCSTHPDYCQHAGDTTYVTLPTKQLPILYPLREYGERTGSSAITERAAALVEPALRVLIETGYDRKAYGTPTPFVLNAPLNPDKMRTLVPDFNQAVQQGIDAANALGKPPARRR
jgi:pimeloyl-ACP methyl ester carboxylesterase